MSKPKIILLWWIITILSIGYSSAVSFSCWLGSCNPWSIELTEAPTSEEFSSVECSSEMHVMFYKQQDETDYMINLDCFTEEENEIYNDRQIEVQNFTPWNYEVYPDENFEWSMTFNFTPSNSWWEEENTWWNTWWWNEWWNEWWNTWWWSNWWWSSWWWIVSWWTEAFSGIITKLWSIFSEFWPYIIYIAIACLWISLLFKALKSLLWFTNNKAKKSIWWREWMKARRTYRRKMRRRRKYDSENYRYKTYRKKWINKKWAREQAKYMTKNRRRIRKNKWAY